MQPFLKLCLKIQPVFSASDALFLRLKLIYMCDFQAISNQSLLLVMNLDGSLDKK